MSLQPEVITSTGFIFTLVFTNKERNSFQIADVYFASLGLQIILHIHAFIFTHIWSFGHPLQKHYYWIRAAALTLRPQDLSFQMLCLTDRSNSYIHVFTFINVRNNLTVEAFVSKLKGSAIYIDSCHKSHNFINNWTKYFLMWYCDPNSWVAESSERLKIQTVRIRITIRNNFSSNYREILSDFN